MAVSFKVPKQKARDIFVIDNFMGVDLTNSGANVDDVRSPYAPNMVRYVPGKVRKRTGFQTNVLFAPDTNVNRALGTSESDVVYELHKWEQGEEIIYTTLYNLDATYAVGTTIYIEFDYKSEHRFWLHLTREWIPASENWTHFSREYELAYSRSNVQALGDNTGADIQTIHIRNFSVMTDKDENYVYKPAPPYFVETSTRQPIYGCHVLKSGTLDTNRVVNVNRILDTSSSFDTFTLDDSTSWEELYSFAEAVYRKDGTQAIKRNIYIDFDYILSGDDVLMSFAGASGSNTKISEVSEETHFGGKIYAGSYLDLKVKAKTEGNSILQIKNLSVCYEVDENYAWSPAPEDNGGTFHTEDIYFVSHKNYAKIDEYHKTGATDSTTYTADAIIADAETAGLADIKGFCHVSFDLHTSTDGDLTKVEVMLMNDQNQWLVKEEFTENLNSKHFDFYVSNAGANYYVKRIRTEYTLAATQTQTTTSVTNIKLNAISPKDVFDISSKYYIYHVGTDFYMRASNSSGFTKIYENANQHISKSWQLDTTLFIIDGKNVYTYDVGDNEVSTIEDNDAYIPLLTYSKFPSGGGISYDPLNMLQPGFYEQFIVRTEDASATEFHLSLNNLDDTETKAWVLDTFGNWQLKTEGTDYTVSRGTGIVTFTSAPGVTPLDGEDNVKILAYKTIPGYRERVTSCTIGTLFGVGGAADRLFLSGNPDYPNWDFYSERNNPSYFPDTGYSSLGSAASAIVGYAIVNNYLATFKDDFDYSQAVFIREGDYIVDDNGHGDPSFKLINTLQGNGVVAPYSFGYLQTEPVFLTKQGVYAITPQDITGEKYSQNRSFYLNGKLLEEDHLENAVAAIYNDMYVLAINNQLYILDGLQATRTDRAEPYATRQYVGFYCTDVPAVCLWTDDGALWFGSSDGRVCRFATDTEALESYNDDGEPITAWWETPDLDGKLFYKNKTFRYFAIRLMKAIRTSVKLYSQKLGTWTFVKEDTSSGVVFDFDAVDFELFSFSTDTSEKVVHTKLRVKKVDKARFKVENSNKNEPFGLFDLALEYIESGNYKR